MNLKFRFNQNTRDGVTFFISLSFTLSRNKQMKKRPRLPGGVLEVLRVQGTAGVRRQQSEQSLQRLLLDPDGKRSDGGQEERHS